MLNHVLEKTLSAPDLKALLIVKIPFLNKSLESAVEWVMKRVGFGSIDFLPINRLIEVQVVLFGVFWIIPVSEVHLFIYVRLSFSI
jgi:hypothetical protein